MAQRLMVTNLVQASASTVTASNEDASAGPATWAQDQLRSKRWKTDAGWVIVAGFNDDLDFTEGVSGDATAGLTAGTYASGALMAAEIETQMDAAATDNTYTVSYSTTTKKFTIARDTGSASFGLEWSTGSNAATSVGACLGFDTSADDTGATSYEGDNASYRSRAWIKVDLGSALAVKASFVVDHNVSTTGTITLQGNATDAWTSPTVDQDLSGDADIQGAYISQQTLRYWRLVIDGVSVDVSYTELGVWYLGSYTEPTYCDAVGRTWGYEQLSEVQVGISGAHFQDERAQRAVWGLNWESLTESDRSALHDALYELPRGTCFFFGWDDTDATDTRYVWLAESFAQALTSRNTWDMGLPVLSEALG